MLFKKGTFFWPRLLAALVVPIPFAAMFWFHGMGPLLREPSPGALDNGGSVAALLQLGERLAKRPVGKGATVQLVFTAAEEERALGSYAYAQTLVADPPDAIFNLESVGASGRLGWVPEDGFELRRFRSPEFLVERVDAAARSLGREPLPMMALPPGTLTDGRSFLAQGLPALTLRASEDGAFPTRLHSKYDSRDRLSVDAIDETVDLLAAIVALDDAR
jgi:Zn-dependent M28 family amino/carboxypeptidase